MQQKFRQYIHQKLYLKSLEMELIRFDDPDFYNNYIWVINDAENRIFSVHKAINIFIINIFKIIIVLTIILAVFSDPILMLFPFATLLVTTILSNKNNKLIYDRNAENISCVRESDYIKRVFYLKEYAKDLRLSLIKNVLMNNFNKTTEKSKNIFRKYSLKIIPLNFLLTLVYELFNGFGTITYLIWRAFSEAITIGSFSGLYNSANNLLTSLKGLFQIINSFYENDLYIQRLLTFIDYVPENKNGNSVLNLNDIPKFTFKLNNVYFKYEKEKNFAIKKINLAFSKGEKIAIVGNNGAGKTTLVNLLLNFYSPNQGSITINDINIKDYDFNNYIQNFNVILQDFKHFAVTIAENIILDVDNNINQEKLWEALENVDLSNKVSELPFGLKTEFTKEFKESGAVLSGGEQQKLALARLFTSDKQILVLDEPSSALDPISEHKIFKLIFNNLKEKTILFISHRLYSATLADTIIVMDNGMIIEKGSHSELIKRNGKYAQLFNAQTESYKLGTIENNNSVRSQSL
jgi:ATP-binding cassette subfamily B protein